MKRQTVKKVVLAIVFTLALTCGLGIVGDQFGFPVTQPAYACNTSNGGGC